MNFDQYMPSRLITGRGCVRGGAARLAKLGEKCLIVTSGSAAKKSGALEDVTAALESVGVEWTVYDRVQANPLLVDSQEAGAIARGFGARFVVGIGGGSALDAAKAAAVYAANEIALLEIYSGWENPALPLVLISTTAGTGSEVAPYAVMTRPDGRKISVSSEQLYPTITFGDAGYTDSLPWKFTVSTALDALSHALEAYFSTAANELSDLYAVRAVRLLLPELTGLADRGEAALSPETRDRLYFASVLAGFALNRCGTCYPHALGYFLSEDRGVAHGAACAAGLPHFLRRAERLLPAKSEALYREAESSCDRLCGLIESLTDVPEITLTPEQIADIAGRYEGSRGFAHTAPEGFTVEEAVAMLTELYGKA